jgi:CubicO group peptidase (beta-lactamase class C family)
MKIMKRFLLLSIFISTSIKAQNIYFPPAGSNNWDTLSPQSLGWCSDALDSLIDFVGSTHAKAFLILKDGKMVVEHYYGTFTVDSSWYWASAGKSLTAFLTGLAQEQGYLNIHDSLPKYLGYGFSSCGNSSEDSIRIIHQLTMTTGFDEDYGGVSTENHCTDDSCLVCIASPGMRWTYHNAPYTIIHRVLNSATGMSVNAFKTINLNAVTGIEGLFFPSGYDEVYVSKARSFARFGLLILNNGVWDMDTIMHDNVYFHDMINSSQMLNPSYGYLWWLNGKASYRLPGTQFQFSGSLVPHAPPDMFAAMGKNDQILNIVPGSGIVLVRMGDPMYSSLEIPNFNNDSIWIRLNRVLCYSNGTDEISNVNEMTLYPNPANDHVNISFIDHLKNFNTEIFNEFGKCVLFYRDQNEINISALQKGVYFIHISSGQKIFYSRFVKINE